MPDKNAASLENVIEAFDLGLEVFHPGGLDTTQELADICHVGNGTHLLDVASGSGEPLCFLVQKFHCRGVGVDASPVMVERAKKKAQQRRLNIEFLQGDAHHLPFGDGTFDVVISECTLCLLDKLAAIEEMMRVARSGGYVGIHDIAWKEDAPQKIKKRLAEIEDEHPETLDGWKQLLERAGLIDVVVHDTSPILRNWNSEVKNRIGILGQLSVAWKILRRWGWRGLRRIKESEAIFNSECMGYGILVGKKP